ncbi:hypothetical protein L1D53_24155, partial [Vibrio alginolyticus]|uniref:hypothetical protein n=1 Tax=Vibrio alginolyticus TaxID=663 RepID=UPI001EFD4A50
ISKSVLLFGQLRAIRFMVVRPITCNPFYVREVVEEREEDETMEWPRTRTNTNPTLAYSR